MMDLVLILVLMEDGCGLQLLQQVQKLRTVLILVLMEDGCGQSTSYPGPREWEFSLNPCFNGRWLRTFQAWYGC